MGLLKEDGATSLTIVQAGGTEHVLLRKDVTEAGRSPASLMPPFAEGLSPADAANVWPGCEAIWETKAQSRDALRKLRFAAGARASPPAAILVFQVSALFCLENKTPISLTLWRMHGYLARMKSLFAIALVLYSVTALSADGVSKWQKGKGWGWVWGKQDEVGSLNEMTDASRAAALRLATQGKVYDLGVLYDRNSYKMARPQSR
jgi:hypothetical protein